MENALSPAFIKINYSSPFAPHTATIATVPYILPDVGNPSGQWQLRGAALPVDADGAVNDLVDLMLPFYESSITFEDYIIYTQADEDAPPLPQYSAIINKVGTGGAGTWSKAVQYTWTWRTTAFGLFKLVMLDALSNNNFDKFTTLTPASAEKALSDYVTADVSWLSGRDNERPSVFLQGAKTLNEKLRRSYRMN